MKKKNIETKRTDSKYSSLTIHNLYDALQMIFITYYKKKNKMYLNKSTRSFVNHQLPSNPNQYHQSHPPLPMFP